MIRVAIVPVLVLAACGSKSERRDEVPAAGSGSTAVADAAAVSSAAPDAPPTVQEHMNEHFAAVARMQEAIALGQLEAARDGARYLIEHDELAVPEWRPFVEDMTGAARDLLRAKDLPTTAVLVANLARTCSRCHEDRAALIAFPYTEPPPDTADLPTQMRRHQWAVSRLWEGLVGPSDEMWTQGATVLAATRLDAAAAAGNLPRGDVPALAARVRELATRAGAERSLDGRGKLYGELLSTCAGCHALVRPRAGSATP